MPRASVTRFRNSCRSHCRVPLESARRAARRGSRYAAPKETGRRGPGRCHAADGRVVHARRCRPGCSTPSHGNTVVGNVHHACHAQQNAVGVEHRRAVEVPSGHGLFVQVEYGDQRQPLRLGAARPRGGARNGLGDLVGVPPLVFGKEPIDGQLGERSPCPRRTPWPVPWVECPHEAFVAVGGAVILDDG